jgi:hypothetical protein
MFAGGINMDYIREELLRQNRILTRLMIGEKSQDELDPLAKEGHIFSEEKDTSAEIRWSRSVVEELTAAGIAVAGTGGEESLRMQRKSESDSGETGWSAFYAVRKDPKETGDAANIRAMSRYIQRDARRYDGGFSIY